MSIATIRPRSFAAALGISAAAMFLNFAGAAHASDGKTWPATICQYWGGTSNASKSDFIVSQFGRILNDANKRLSVVCPLERDSQTHKIEELRVFAISNNCVAAGQNQACAGLTTRCTFRVMNLTGDWIRFTSTQTLKRFDESNQPEARMTARWTNVSVPSFGSGTALHNGSSFVLFCEIGPHEELSGIYLQEGS
jgi:hypothetical protein